MGRERGLISPAPLRGSFLVSHCAAQGKPRFPRTSLHTAHLFTPQPPCLPPAKIIITMADLSGWASSILWGGGWVGNADKWRCGESTPWQHHGNCLRPALAADLCTNTLGISMQVVSRGEVFAIVSYSAQPAWHALIKEEVVGVSSKVIVYCDGYFVPTLSSNKCQSVREQPRTFSHCINGGRPLLLCANLLPLRGEVPVCPLWREILMRLSSSCVCF